MEHSVNILSELQAISPEVARIGRQLPYEVPAGYFEALAAQVMQQIREEEAALPPVLQQAGANPYSVPAGYFDQLAGNILARVKASDEGLSAQEELSMLSPLLSKLDKKLPFQAPAGYFSDLSDNVVSGVQAIEFVNEELENLSPLMAGLKDKQVYEVPAGYFDALPEVILDSVKNMHSPAKVVSIGFGRKLMRYAVAAAVIGIVAMGAWWFMGGKPDAGAITDIVASKEVDKLSTEELQSYLDEVPVAVPADLLAANTKPEIEESDMSDLFQNVSDEEIQKYLDQNLLSKNTGTN
ncbi:MAG: hypothetical protein J7621_10010 [Niastella sp.]|nr:hypothetical protein [Niastella sp.]